jgi:cytochrome c oxidase cbb3-type subunit 3
MWTWLAVLALAFHAAAQVTAEPDPAAGKKLFTSQCALCHGVAGGGGRGPSLVRAQLHHAPDDAALRGVIENGIPPEMPGAWQLSPREVASMAAYVKSLGSVAVEPLTGDAARGAGIYEANGCGNCHINGGRGEGFGPELTGIGSRRNAAYLRETLRDPAAAPPDGFVYLTATTKSGETVRGIRVNEDTFTVQVKDARGRFHSMNKLDLKELRASRKETPMPSYGTRLSAGELEDLVAYLAGLRGTGL